MLKDYPGVLLSAMLLKRMGESKTTSKVAVIEIICGMQTDVKSACNKTRGLVDDVMFGRTHILFMHPTEYAEPRSRTWYLWDMSPKWFVYPCHSPAIILARSVSWRSILRVVRLRLEPSA